MPGIADVSRERVESAHKGPDSMDGAAPGIEKWAGRVLAEFQVRPVTGRVESDTFCCGDTEGFGNSRDFVWIDLNLLVMAAVKALIAGKSENGISIKICLSCRNAHDGISACHEWQCYARRELLAIR